jgi:hypothetical protein
LKGTEETIRTSVFVSFLVGVLASDNFLSYYFKLITHYHPVIKPYELSLLHIVQTGSGVRPTSYKMGTGGKAVGA